MSEELITVTGMSVAIGMPIAPKSGVPAHTVASLCETIQKCTELGVKCDRIFEISGVIQMGRDGVLDAFLKGDSQKLFWIDSDMVWTPDDFLRMLAMSTRVDVVGAAYPAKVEGPTTFYADFAADRRVGPFGLQEIRGLGLGFTIMDRAVCEKLASGAPRVKDSLNGREQAAVFRVDIFNGERRTEDMAFFADIRDAGYTVWMDPSIELGHIGDKVWRGKIANAFQQKKDD